MGAGGSVGGAGIKSVPAGHSADHLAIANYTAMRGRLLYAGVAVDRTCSALATAATVMSPKLLYINKLVRHTCRGLLRGCRSQS